MGLGREFYEPIARAIDGLNNQLNINAKRADDREAAGLNRLLVASQLETAQENRELNKKSSERQDKQLALAIEANRAARKQAIIDESRNAIRFKQEKDNNLVLQERNKSEMIKYKVMNTPKPINIYNYLGDNSIRTKNLFSNPKNVEIIEKMHGENIRFDPATGFLYKKNNNKKVEMSPIRYNTLFSPKLMNLPYLITDPSAVIRGDISQAKTQIAGLKTQLKELNDPVNKGVGIKFADKAKLKQQIKSLESQVVASANTPTDVLIDRYREREDKLTKFAIANQYNPYLTNQIALAQSQNKAMLDRLYKLQGTKLKNGLGAGGKGFGTDDKWRQVDINLSNYYYNKDEKGQYIITKPQRVRYDRAMKLAAEKMKQGMWHMDAANFARAKVETDENAYFNVLENISREKFNGDILKGINYMKRVKRDGKTLNQRAKANLGYIPNVEAYIEERGL